MAEDALTTLAIGIIGGAIRVGTPYLFVSLGECITEKSGRVNLGLEGILVAGAMSAYAGAYLTQSAWTGVMCAALVGLLLGLLHGLVCSLPRVNDIAFGIALMLLGIGLAFFFGKPYIQPQAPQLPSLPLGAWIEDARWRTALAINPLFPLGLLLTGLLHWGFRSTRIGLALRLVGDHEGTARALACPVRQVRVLATAAGGACAGIGGAYLSLVYPGSWSEGLSSGQGIMAVALVIFARWRPLGCLAAAMLFGATGALGPALQAIGYSAGYHLFNAAPYALTLAILIASARPHRTLAGAPGELSLTR
ncbi:MAG TPA: ABC transporter permease [Gammaproteobacteria bacterium]|uniref:ABC transporter permease n=1 Tax=Immundisolibacter sp. TaxID=1934948 RepID=UPI000E83BBAB|nr:ABC transporter permease [Gammaproteobacteria bacterium]MCH79196.1 ABC transporter permease [Gammaproteobacteria bacterium]